MRVHIAIPYRDEPRHPDAWGVECLESIQAQTYRDWEVTWIGERPRPAYEGIVPMRVVEMPGGCPGCINAAFQGSTADLFFFLSANDLIHPEYLAAAVDALENDREAEIWSSNGGGLDENVMHNAVICGAFVIRSRAWRRLGGLMIWPEYPEEVGLEDWHLWMRVYRAGIKVAGDARGLWHYRDHSATGAAGRSREFICSRYFELKLAWMRKTADEIEGVL